MPRKTKKQKQKIAAKYRPETLPSSSVKREFTFSFERDLAEKQEIKKSDNSFHLQQNKLVLHDLAKTLLIAMGIVSLELVIYWVHFK